MQVLNLKAEPDVQSGGVALSWTNPTLPAFRGTRILRREGRFPEVPADLGTAAEIHHDAVTPAGQEGRYLDGPLQGETVYYYAVVAYDATSQVYPSFVSAMATTPYQTASHLYRNLPEIYQLFDQARSLDQGPLRRLVEMFGQPFDLLRSFASGMRNLRDVARIDGTLLPLLAHWIGHPSDTTLDFARQRNEIRYAPHYYRTVGVPANLRAAINRFTNWDARLKEFVHNVFLTNHPEQLTISEMRRQGTAWQPAQSVNLDVAYEGRVAPLRTQDGRVWLFYHARVSTPASEDQWHLFGKTEKQEQGLPSFRLSFGNSINKHPTAVQRVDGSIWLFSSGYEKQGRRLVPRIKLQLLSAGRPALPARVVGTLLQPFPLAEGDQFNITISAGLTSVARRVTVHAEQFRNIAQATAAEVAGLLDHELPGVDVTASADGRVLLMTRDKGSGAVLTLPASSLGAKLGLTPLAPVRGSDAVAAQLTGRLVEPFALAPGDQLVLKMDADDIPRTVTFQKSQFLDIAQATAVEVVAAVGRELPGVAEVAGGAIRFRSLSAGEESLVCVYGDSSAARKLGFGVPLPPAPIDVDDDEPAACVDAADNVWLFWASRRDGTWKVWYNRCDGAAWGVAKPLTTAPLPDRQPFVLFDPAAGGGRLWVFWSRKKANGLWNAFSRTATNLNFPALTDADWTEQESTPVPADFDNREPAATMADTGEVELYFASNRADGWNVWTKRVTPTTQGAETAVTTGQATHRAPTALRVSGVLARLWLRTNESQVYTSTVYPAAQTIDGRYSGSTSLDMRNATKLSLRRNVRDMQRYTYDTRKGDDNLYARDTVGVYLTPDTDDQALILRHRRLFANALRRVIPMQVRLVFLVDQVYPEVIYTYDRPDVTPPHIIREQMVDTILPEVLRGLQDSHRDRAPGVRFMRTWGPGQPLTLLPDLSVTPPNLSFRLYTRAYDEGVET